MGCLFALNKKRYKMSANKTIAKIAAPKFKYLFSTQTDIEPAKKKMSVCTTSYMESSPMTEGVKIRFCVIVWNTTVEKAIAHPVTTIAAMRIIRLGKA